MTPRLLTWTRPGWAEVQNGQYWVATAGFDIEVGAVNFMPSSNHDRFAYMLCTPPALMGPPSDYFRENFSTVEEAKKWVQDHWDAMVESWVQ